MRKLVASLCVAGGIAAAGAQPAAATNECRGLLICVPVAGPWVAVPAGLGVPRARVDFQLSCPRRYAIGGLDAELGDRAVDIGFVGTLGGPVGPGVTTGRAAVFAATYVGASARAPSFRPHLGCIPPNGGGGGPVPYRRVAAAAAFPPGEPTVRRVRNLRLRPGVLTVFAACGAGERLVSGWHAVGFYTSGPPDATLLRSVRTARTVRGGRVAVRVAAGPAAGQVRTIVQVGAVCAGGE